LEEIAVNNNFKDFMNNAKFSDEEKKELNGDAERLVRKYATMSQNELSNMSFQEVSKQKANGTFDKDKLFFMLDSIKHLLPNDAYNNIFSALKDL
jgi:hypothetical protein